MLSFINKPVKLDFFPVSVETQFQKSLKFQIAIFRSSTDEKGKRVLKMDKTQPMKFTNPQQKITLSNKLSLLTTIPYDHQAKLYDNKQIEFEMALQVDGSKSRLAKKINLRELLESKQKMHKFVSQQASVVLFYKAEVKFQAQEKPENGINQNPKRKIIRFDQGSKENENQDVKYTNNESGAKADRDSRHKTITGEMKAEPIQKIKQQVENKEKKLVKSRSLNGNMNDFNKKQDNCSIEGNIMTQPSQDKIKILNNINYSLEVEKKQLQKKLKQKDSKITELLQHIEQIIKKNDFDTKSDKSVKQLFKKEKISLEKQIVDLKEQIKSYKKQIERLSKTAINYQQSSKNIAVGSESEIRTLKDRIRQLQKNQFQNTNQIENYFCKLKDKQQIVADLKGKVLVLEKDNLELRQKIKECQKKLERQKEQYQIEIDELKQNFQQIKNQNKNLKLPSSKDLKQDTSDLKKKIQTLEKQLDRKEELLKKMTQMKKNNEQDIVQQNSALKKEVSQLKQMIDRLESKRSQQLSSTTSIQYRVQMQKMKKQLQLCKRNEKSLLIEKGKLQTSNKQFQEDVVRGKQTIVNILNLVQQTGNQKLISEAYSLMQ